MENKTSKIDELDVYGDQVKEVLSNPPSKLYTLGNLIVIAFLFIVIFLTWFIRFPEVILSEIVVTTKNKPVNIVSNIDGNISYLFVSEKDTVETGDNLAVISNEVDYTDLNALKAFLDIFVTTDLEKNVNFPTNLQIGLLQIKLNELEGVCNQYFSYRSIKPEKREQKKVVYQIKKLKLLDKNLQKQENLYEEHLDIFYSDLKRQEQLYNEGTISKSDVEKIRITAIDKKRELQAIKYSQAQNAVAIANLDKEYQKLETDEKQSKESFRLQIQNIISKLNADILNWETSHIIKAKQNGTIAFLDYLEEKQYVSKGTELFTIVGKNKDFIGQGYLPQNKSGKVKHGQDVIIKLLAFPEKEFGSLTGHVQDISIIPNNDKYLITVEIPNGLKTSYLKELPLKPRYSGSAEIVTEDLRLLERIFYELRSILIK